MRIVVALGGNALMERGERPDADVQRRHVREAAQALVPLAAEHDLVLCHGNGPQVGTLALESESDPALSQPYPLDTLGAETQGMIGYWLAQELHNSGVAKPITTVVTQTVVDAADPAFLEPRKFIGPAYSHHHAHALAQRHDWQIAEDGAVWRRVVASPEPQAIVELPAIRQLTFAGTVVICVGGGGVPVAEDEDGTRHGVEAVVDKDLATALLAEELDADAMLLLTDVPAVMRDFGTAAATPIGRVSVAELRDMTFADGSMGPKVRACVRFVEATSRTAAIGRLSDAAAILDGTAGTTVIGSHDRASTASAS
jgi:carbamate kinase